MKRLSVFVVALMFAFAAGAQAGVREAVEGMGKVVGGTVAGVAGLAGNVVKGTLDVTAGAAAAVGNAAGTAGNAAVKTVFPDDKDRWFHRSVHKVGEMGGFDVVVMRDETLYHHMHAYFLMKDGKLVMDENGHPVSLGEVGGAGIAGSLVEAAGRVGAAAAHRPDKTNVSVSGTSGAGAVSGAAAGVLNNNSNSQNQGQGQGQGQGQQQGQGQGQGQQQGQSSNIGGHHNSNDGIN